MSRPFRCPFPANRPVEIYDGALGGVSGVGVVVLAHGSGTRAEDLAGWDGEQLVVLSQASGSLDPGISARTACWWVAEVGDEEWGRISCGVGAPGSGVVVERSADLRGRRLVGGAFQAAPARAGLCG
ncbi:MAG: hypothetical protein ACR2JF_05460 [Iamia sp.]